jgi:hypothetical protein
MDIQMPNLNSYESASAIRSINREDIKMLPIIAMSADAFVEDIYNTTVANIGGDYTYTYIEAVGCGDKSDDLSINEIIELMNSIYEESGRDTTFEDTIKESKYAVFDIMADVNGTSYTYNDQVIYIFNCTDGIYIYG